MVMLASGFHSKFNKMKKTYIGLILLALIGCKDDPVFPPKTVPFVSLTNTVSNITSTSARSGGVVTLAGGSVIQERGICWSTSSSPTIANSKTVDPGGLGSFTADLTNLTPGTLYYVRAFATNATGTLYGNQVSFTSLNTPTVSTNNITSITTTSAISGGNVSSSGGASVTARGVCWSTSMNPTIALSTKTLYDGTGTGSFSSSITGLSSMTTYYVRAYATNSVGTSYGENLSFRTN
jgi:hypothetical protein